MLFRRSKNPSDRIPGATERPVVVPPATPVAVPALDRQLSPLDSGRLAVEQGYFGRAFMPLREAVRRQPNSPWPYFYLAQCYLALGDFPAAKQHFRKALGFDPGNPHLQPNVAYVDHLAKQEAEIADFVDTVRAADVAGPRKRPLALLIVPGPVLPPKLGVVQRIFHEMAALGARTDLVVASLLYEKKDHVLERAMRAYCRLPILGEGQDHPPLVAGASETVHRHSSISFHRALMQLAELRFDLVVTDFVYMAPYAQLFEGGLRVLSEHNVESQILRRNASLRRISTENPGRAAELDEEASRLEQFERQTWSRFPLRWAVSENDKLAIDASSAGKGETWLVRNGYDVAGTAMLRPNSRRRLLFAGTLNYWPNIDAVEFCVRDIMPLVWRRDPTVELCVAGANPTAYVEQWCMSDRRIRLVRNPPDMTEVAAGCSAAIIPIRTGSGTRIKILETLTLGLPTVTTGIGCEGLDVEDGRHVLVRDDPEAMADAIIRILDDASLREDLRREGRALVEAQYDWSAIFAKTVDRLLARLDR